MALTKRQISIKDCYEILKLQKGADLQAVKTAYRKRAFELHPDLNPGNGDAQRQFQLLNEAYVALSAMLKPVEEAKQKAASQKMQENDKTGEQATEKTGESSGEKKEEFNSAEKARAQHAYAEQDVLRDLLNDPFARRVFEDIYSEMAKKQQSQPREEKEKAETKVEEPKPRTTNPSVSRQPTPVRPASQLERGQGKGVKGALKNWFRKQIDEELHLTFPAARLTPGKKIPLTVTYGLNNETQTVEVTIPRNFVAGKPMRLKGLGKRLGPLQGDLYLTIHSV